MEEENKIMEEEKKVKILKRILLNDSPILFTGSGFSYGATNNSGEIPSAPKLKELIIDEILHIEKKDSDYLELSSYSLMELCEHANLHYKNRLEDFLTDIYSDCIPNKDHKTICSYSWERIYTTNIDDIVEQSIPKEKLVVQNMSRKNTGIIGKSTKTEYIKLHGCVRNKNNGYIFSSSNYIDSMIQSRDYRFNQFGIDIQTRHFIFLGTSYDEMNLDYYTNLYKDSPTSDTSKGWMFFINPKPSIKLKDKINSINGILIQWTTKQFSDFIEKEILDKNASSTNFKLPGFLNLNIDIDKYKRFESYRSNLYIGYYPKWEDIFHDWDFINQEVIDNFKKCYSRVCQYNQQHTIYSLVGKSLSGKSTFLKRIGYFLYKEGYVVLEYSSTYFDYHSFANYCRFNSKDKICLLIDDASYYYGAIHSLLQLLPRTCNIFVVTTSRPYPHSRKKYNVVLDNFYEYFIPIGISHSYAIEIENKLSTNGYLGALNQKSKKDRIEFIDKSNDILDCLYSITFGSKFQDRIISRYKTLSPKMGMGADILAYLAIFQQIDLPYLPLELITIIFGEKAKEAITDTDDFIKISKTNGLTLRNGLLAQRVIEKMSTPQKIRYIKTLLINLSPQVSNDQHTYWNEIEAALMKEKLLRRKLKLRTDEIKSMLFDIQSYYSDSYNYWIQVGISEQMSHEYEKALNHFQYAESIDPNSYMVQNAIARNFLKQANHLNTYTQALPIFREGECRMQKLIDERDEFQVKAFSTHCYLYEKINFNQKFGVIPDDDEIKKMYQLLKRIVDKIPDDGMSKHISNKFYKFLKWCQKTNLIKLDFYDLSFLNNMLTNYELDVEKEFEDFEIDE